MSVKCHVWLTKHTFRLSMWLGEMCHRPMFVGAGLLVCFWVDFIEISGRFPVDFTGISWEFRYFSPVPVTTVGPVGFSERSSLGLVHEASSLTHRDEEGCS